VYVVLPGDTLSSIARQFDVSVESLMAANGLSDPNVLSVGQTLIIPTAVESGTSPTEALPPTSTLEAPLPTATRDPNAPLPRLIIREVIGAGSLADESLVIVNQGGPVDLAGWTLRDESGHLYTFPSLTLFTDGAIKVHTTSGVDTVTDLYWGQAEAVWASGKVVLLSDPGGNLQARFTVA
jgi:murein DD-endopeptidase MepM/ murein hydrolase activator NlpD